MAVVASWIVLLRAVNLGATRKFPMAHLRELLTDAGYEQVETHIQSGNVRLTSRKRAAGLEKELEALFEDDRGFRVATFVLSPQELREIAEAAHELSVLHKPQSGHYVSVLREAPDPEVAAALEDLRREKELVVVRGRAVHLLYDLPYHQAKTSNAALEKLIGEATNRNARVIAALAEKWAPPS